MADDNDKKISQRAAEILGGDISNWLDAHDQWPVLYKVTGLGFQVVNMIPADKRGDLADQLTTAGKAGDRTKVNAVVRNIISTYAKENPNANTEDLLAAIDSHLTQPGAQLSPRDVKLDAANNDDRTFAGLAREANDLAGRQIAREAAAVPAAPVIPTAPTAPAAPVVASASLLDEMMKHKVEGIYYNESFDLQGHSNWGAFYAHQQVLKLDNFNNDNAANGRAIHANAFHELTVKATQANTVVLANLNDAARDVDHSYQIGSHAQKINITSGDSGYLASDATLALTVSEDELKNGKIRGIAIGNDGSTTVTLNDGRSVQSNNKVVFRYKSGAGTDTNYHQMTAQEMKTWLDAHPVAQAQEQKPVAVAEPVAQPVTQPVYYQPSTSDSYAPYGSFPPAPRTRFGHRNR